MYIIFKTAFVSLLYTFSYIFQNGSKYASYNYIYKRRKGESSKGIKVTSVVTSKGIPISVCTNKGSCYDSPLLPNIVNNCVINTNTKKYSKHNRYKQYFLADSGESLVNRTAIRQLNLSISLLQCNKDRNKVMILKIIIKY